MREVSVLERFRQLYQQWKFTADEEKPIRAELFAPEKLIEQARILAHAQEIHRGAHPDPELLKHFHKNSAFLHAAYDSIIAAVSSGDPIPPAEEWFLDNFHVIAEQLAGIKEDLPKKFYLELPALATGTMQGYPRAYEMALQLIAHADSRLDADTLREYIHSYQSVSTLTTGELWAIAIFLRVGLIENLKRLILVSDRERGARLDANRFAERLIAATSNEEIPAILKERSRDPRRIGGAFALQLILRLRDTPPAHFAAVEWLYGQLSHTGMDPDEMIRRQQQDLGAAQVSVSNAIQSLRLLGAMDWSELVEDVSLVDAELRKDPSGHYARCDFATRDRYRHVIEDIAKRSKLLETEISAQAISLAAASLKKDPADHHKSHVGYYLIHTGRQELEKRCGFQPGFFLTLRRGIRSRPALFYQAPILLLTILFTALGSLYAARHTDDLSIVFLAGLACFLLASALAVIVTNWLLPLFLKPRILPKLELKEGIPEEFRAFVVLPSLLLNSAEVGELVSRLEVTYLGNSEDTLDFAMLTDFTDSDVQMSPADESLLAEASNAIAALNLKYPRSEAPRFHIFHRRRLWNESEARWMGWERKRGKLEEFNRLLLGSRNTSYITPEAPGNIKYVITLDADTILPRDSARKLVGTITHPLNAAVVDPTKKQVVEGYGILQPRVSHSLTSANQTWFSRIISGHTGIDPYTTAVSDIYQDLFREASYVGKGIYDLAAFSAATDPRFPENRLLSHDLIEGAFARTALVSDCEIFDDQPSDYTSYILRLHRWVRGDWQVAPWILPRVPGPGGNKVPNTLSWLNRWKLFDNLRRSLVSPALFLCLLLGWTVLPGSPLFWSAAVVAVIFSPLLIQFISGALSPPGKARWLGRLWGLSYDAGFNALHSLLQLSLLPNEAWVMTDAIARTLFRMIRRKKMLEWTTAAQAEKFRGSRFHHYVLRLRWALILTAAAFVIVLAFKAGSLPEALPFLLLWIASPVFAFLTGKPIPRRERKISPSMLSALRGYAREIWRFFETLVGDDTHWLPPDNFQEIREPLVAPRTSPTNIGFLLLSNIAAYDLGYIGAVEFVERTEKTLETLSQLKTFNGHLFNWYSTTNLEPLEPRYVSTVDSGNLVAALIVLKQFALRLGLNVARSFEPRTGRYEGVRDTIHKLLQLAVKDSNPDAGTHGVRAESGKKNNEAFGEMRRLLAIEPLHTTHQEELLESLKKCLDGIESAGTWDGELHWWLNASKHIIDTHLADYERPQDIASRLVAISRDSEAFAQEIDFRFLFNEKRGIFAIGFNVTNGQLDRSSYDLFASEARLASFVAIAKGDVPQSHWFRMSRAMISFGRMRILASWSGSMFEYLMPLLFLSNEPRTLMDVTYRGSVDLQRLYGFDSGVPWGISEAAYNARDLSRNYQYGPFGVPALGFKRGLARDLVVAPYATFLALMIRPRSAFRNLEHLNRLGSHGRFGFYESIDFTKDRVPKGREYAVVKTFMAHHQGMSLMALDNILHNDIMQSRFHSDPSVQATSLLLQEKMPLSVRSTPVHVVDERLEVARIAEPSVAREFRSPFITPPRTQLLSNGNYLVMITTGGGGYSECQGIRLSRWREDVTRDHWGPFLYIRDLQSGDFWSAGFQPTLRVPDDYRVVFAEDQAEIRRRDGQLETHFDVSVSPEDNVEIRRVTLVNTSGDFREMEITSYLELVLNTAAADLTHPAFGNLFVETEYVPEIKALLASRRPRSSDETVYWAAHLMMCEDANAEMKEYETDRARFIGRNRSVANPNALTGTAPLSGTTGAVLDPIFSVRSKIRVEPYSRQVVAVMTMIGQSREEVISLAEKYCNARAVSRGKELAAVHAQIRLNQMSMKKDEADLFQRVAGRLIYSDLSLRPRPAVLARNSRTQAALWPYGISGDLPICLVRIEEQTEIEMVRQLLRAHEYWRTKGLVVDLVILNEYPSSYFQELQEELLAVIRSSASHQRMDVPGGVFLRRADLMSEEDQILLRTVARVQIVAQRGSLARQVARVEAGDPLPQPHIPLSQYPIIDPPLNIPVPELIFDNGFGGFTTDGKEYVIRLKDGDTTPAPWINVIANPEFGFQISETGAGMTWSVNSHENRLTPWSNDAVSDTADSAIYIRDEDSGHFWSPTPQPAPAKGNYVVAHGTGYTRFNYGGYGLDQELLIFAAKDSPVKILKLRLRNPARRSRTLSVTYFAELALGVTPSQSARFVVTSIDPATGAVLATNAYNNEFAGRLAFLWMNNRRRTVSGNRTTFLGPNGDLRRPAAMSSAQLSGKVGAGLDPCAAVQGQIQLAPLSEHTVLFLFGEGKDLAEVRNLIATFNTVEAAEGAYEDCRDSLEKTLNSIQVKTPDHGFDLMLNRWLLVQTYSSRFFSRSAFYQSGGAFGFRDQLQDAMALVCSAPNLMREHLLRCAARQFLEGDVQHWWHPPTGRGVRTRSSDDLLWLPYCTAHYVRTTGDIGVLEETAPYLEAPALGPGQMEAYLQPVTSKIAGSLYDHCVKAIEHSMKFGAHGLPLIGSGDWNDGMNRLGIAGKGESVWLAWFQISILKQFADICESRHDNARAETFRKTTVSLIAAVEEHGWDGEWYLRGFDDDGVPFGSSRNQECRIDSIAQSWAVLSHSADTSRAKTAMESVERLLIHSQDQLALLLTPPFVDTPRDPGYIKGYPAGIRENGGHYNHAAIWLIAAFAELGLPEKALQLFHMCSPITHSSSREKAEKYKVEPYVAVGDIYSHPSHIGRGGWSWYTGSAGWLYRAGLEWILGFRLHGDHFTLNPCIPAAWPGYEITFRHGPSTYHITVENRSGDGGSVQSLEMDGQPLKENSIPLTGTAGEHQITAKL
jgi:cellobiose phosphorylase